ncbi:response regulator transcription factor [Streptomyces sp. ATexAB-D23]|uniref:response regulator transcription factor n=1 Tax=unclassified Streptomyces TaxID=2593676 RepID=UPI0003750784|nr:response regulator transcription factor [Streptomyces sp. ATexAB-D23]
MPDDIPDGPYGSGEQRPPQPPAPAFPAPAATALRVLVADDNPVVRAGLTALLHGRGGIVVVAEAGDGRQAYEKAVRHRPDVVLLDVRMPGVDGISALPHLVRLAPVLMMTYSSESAVVRQALRLGAGGYLVHGEFTAAELVAAVRDTAEGRARFTHSASGALLESLRERAAPEDEVAPPLPDGLGTVCPGAAARCPAEPYSDVPSPRNAPPTGPFVGHSTSRSSAPAARSVLSELSEREVEVMDLIASGMSNQQIAAACFISQKTVKNHINRIFTKLNVGSRGEAIALWHRRPPGGPARHG